jgi:hypothetical protein
MHHIIDSLSFNMVIIRIANSDGADSHLPRIHQVNRSAESLLGYSEKELSG